MVGLEAWERLPTRLRKVFWTFCLPLVGPRLGRSRLEELLTEAEAGEAQSISDWCLLRLSLSEIGHRLTPLPSQRLLELPRGPVRTALMRSLPADSSFLRELYREDWLADVPEDVVSKVILPYTGGPEEGQRMVSLARSGHFRLIFRFLARSWSGGSEQARLLLQKIGAQEQVASMESFLSSGRVDAGLCQFLELHFEGSPQAWSVRTPEPFSREFQVDFTERKGSCSYARFDYAHRDGLTYEDHPWHSDEREPVRQTLEDWVREHFLAFALHD
jgi:hypothetical protein